MIKLYNVPRNTWVMPIEATKAPPGAREVSIGEAVWFDHVDGLYSYCKDLHGQVVYLAAWQEVTICEPPP